MTRSLANLPDENIKSLDQLAAEQGKLCAAVQSVNIRWYRQHVESRK
jgi:hypothetical protein